LPDSKGKGTGGKHCHGGGAHDFAEPQEPQVIFELPEFPRGTWNPARHL
jgi:hypothetical protein